MKVKVPPSPIRLLKERYFGEEARNPWVAKNKLAELSARLPPGIVPIVTDAVQSLIDYQDPDYALLYLDRIERYVGPAGVTLTSLGELASLLSARMHFEDPIRIAQLKLIEAGGVNATPNPESPDRVERFRWDEIIQMLPPAAAAPAMDVFARLRLARLARRTIKLRFSSTSRFGLQKLRGRAALRITRPFSQRFKTENTWVERWLHMVDRSLVKQPEAAAEIVRTAELITGHGDAYQNGMAQWNIIIDSLVKPTCDGTLPLRTLKDAVKDARQAVSDEPGNGRLLQAVEYLKMHALAGSHPGP